jgi:hypothetical protein
VKFRSRSGFERGAQLVEIEGGELGRQQLELDAALDERLERLGVDRGHFRLGGEEMVLGVDVEEAKRFASELVEQQPGGDVGVVGLFLHQGAGAISKAVDTSCAEMPSYMLFMASRMMRSPSTSVRPLQASPTSTRMRATSSGAREPSSATHLNRRLAGCSAGCRLRASARAGALLAVEHVVAGHLVLAGAHQRQLHLILNVFDVDRAAGREAALEGGADLTGELCHQLADARRGCRGAAFHRQERLGHGQSDLVVGVGHHGAVALDDLELPWGRGGDGRRQRLRRGRVRGGAGPVFIAVVLIGRGRDIGLHEYSGLPVAAGPASCRTHNILWFVGSVDSCCTGRSRPLRALPGSAPRCPLPGRFDHAFARSGPPGGVERIGAVGVVVHVHGGRLVLEFDRELGPWRLENRNILGSGSETTQDTAVPAGLQRTTCR